MNSIENQNEEMELNREDLEKASAGSWLGRIWNMIKSFGGGSGNTDVTDCQTRP